MNDRIATVATGGACFSWIRSPHVAQQIGANEFHCSHGSNHDSQ